MKELVINTFENQVFTWIHTVIFEILDRNAMEVLAMEIGRNFMERSLEISFANALSAVNSGISQGDDQAFIEAALQAQLISYAGMEEIESMTGSLNENLTQEMLCSPQGRKFSLRSPSTISGQVSSYERMLTSPKPCHLSLLCMIPTCCSLI